MLGHKKSTISLVVLLMLSFRLVVCTMRENLENIPLVICTLNNLCEMCNQKWRNYQGISADSLDCRSNM